MENVKTTIVNIIRSSLFDYAVIILLIVFILYKLRENKAVQKKMKESLDKAKDGGVQGFLRNLIQDRAYNYPMVVIVSCIVFVLFYILYLVSGMDDWLTATWAQQTFVTILGIGSLIFTWTTSELKIEPMTRIQLLFLGQETGIWLSEGTYFVFFHSLGLFTLFKAEEQKTEKKDGVMAPMQCQDKNGKGIVVEANWDWKIKNSDNFQQNDANTMGTNLVALVTRTAKRVCGKLVYKTHILGEDIGELILKDKIFIRECEKYGIEFHNLIADAVALDLTQENLNAYYEELWDKAKEKYPTSHVFTQDERDKIEDSIQVKLKLAKRIINSSGSPILGRYDI